MSVTNNHNNDIHKLVQAEQVRLLYAGMPLSILAIVINSAILVIFQWQVISHFILLSWLIVLLIITLIRGYSVRAYNSRKDKHNNSQHWLSYFTVGVIVSGFIWGSATIWLFPDYAVGNQVLLAFVIAGMSAGATTSLSYDRGLIITFLFLLLIPLSIRFYLIGDNVSIAMGTLSLVFFIMMSSVSMRNYKNIVDNISLRIEAGIHEKVLRESEEKYRHIFNFSPIGIVHYNSDGVITDYNKYFVELFGVPKEEINNFNLVNDAKDKEFHDAVSQSLQGELSLYEGITKDIIGNKDTDIRVFFSGMHLDDSEISGGVAILEDISEDKRVKKLKDEFISTISHELRTPLTAIKGAVGLLRGGAVGEVSGAVNDMLDITSTNTERLLLLINDILDIDKIESGTMVFVMKPIEVMEFLDDAVKATETYAQQYKVKFKITQQIENEYLLGDRQRLMQVMYNLLSNAAKFSENESTVEVAASLDNDKVVISITDFGEGIPEDFQAKVFERFTQADATDSRQIGGSGLGLSISKVIVDKHHGKIDFSTSNKGTTFRVWLERTTVDKSIVSEES